MSKAKPLMFGAALGASAMFFAQQYHVIQSHDGLRVIPRAPQQSVGLAYADVRNWGPSQWTDRPELARALMANGATDLISKSVASSMADLVSEDTSTLDELRGFLHGSSKDGSSAEGGLLSLPPFNRSGLESDSDKDAGNKSEEEDNDLFKIPFPQDARTKLPADPFREARAAEKTVPVQSDTGSRFSADELMDDRPAVRTNLPAKDTDNEPSARRPPIKSAAEQAKEMEELLFGKPPAETTAPKPVAKPEDTDGLFEEVTTQLETRAQEALTRAQTTIKDKAVASAESSAASSSTYVRDKAAEMVPEAAKNLLKSAGATVEAPKAASTTLLDFDPFLE